MEDHIEAIGTKNGGLNHNPSGVVNPAFQFGEPDSSPNEENVEDYSVNHLIYRRQEDNNNTNFTKSNRQKIVHLQNIATLSSRMRTAAQAGNVGSRMRTAAQAGNLGKSQTLGRNFAPAAYNAPTYNTVSHHPIKTYNYISRHLKNHRKHDYISYFDIETDQAPMYKYRPGETVTGRITLIVKKAFDIKFVQLVTTGQGRLRKLVSEDGCSRTYRETYFDKDECFMDAGDVRVSSVLFPGQYTSTFCVKLPNDLPSSIHHKDDANGFVLDVFYTLKARLCVKAGVSPLWHTSAHQDKVRVLLDKQIPFKVERDFDLNSIPDAMAPIVHTEQVYMTCRHQEAATVSIKTDRTVFLAGDNIRMHLQVSLPTSQSVKDIKCCLQEHVITSHKNEPMIFSFSKITRKDYNHGDGKLTNPNRQKNFVVDIPTHTDLVSPYSLGNSRLSMNYFLSVDVRFTPAGGKLSFKIPVGIGPCSEPENAEKIPSRGAIPFFNRTIRFPYFSARKCPDTSSKQLSSSSRTSSVVVTTKYSHGIFTSFFLCCIGVVD